MRGALFGVPIIRTIVFWDLSWGPPSQGNCNNFEKVPVAVQLKVRPKTWLLHVCSA